MEKTIEGFKAWITSDKEFLVNVCLSRMLDIDGYPEYVYEVYGNYIDTFTEEEIYSQFLTNEDIERLFNDWDWF